MPPKTPLLEKIIEYFLNPKLYIKLLTSILLAVVTIWIFHNYPTITKTYIPNAIKFIVTPTRESLNVLFIVLVIIFFCKNHLALSVQNLFSKLTSKYFMLLLAGLAIIGASAALFIPSYTNWFRENDSAKSQQPVSTPQPTQSGQDTGTQQKQESKNSASELRGHLLYITGGVIAVLGLIETNRKNSQEHIRQVHASRRDRYIEAVDKLSSENAPVRLGGVYALVGLVDEWLDDDNIDKEIRIKEGQIIINNLCSYIRSPFPLAEKIEEYEARNELEELKKKESKSLTPLDSLHLMIPNKRFTENNDEKKIEQITAEYAKIQEEQDVRRTIFVEISKRSSTFAKDKIGKVIDTFPGKWSEFDFDFSRAPIFYPLTAITIEKGNFSSAKFYSEASFNETTFSQDADFSGATFTSKADFMWASFAQDADFSGTTFAQDADFSGATFTQDAFFMLATFTQDAFFISATFARYVVFISATFTSKADFSGATFTQDTIFMSATFTGKADFSEATFTKDTNFSEATFIKNVTFNDTIFKKHEPTFVRKNSFTRENSRARFSVSMAQEDYNFSLRSDSRSIQLGKAELDGIIRWIPIGAVLFDPDSWDEEKWKYTRESKPAKPLENSDTAEEKPAG